MSSKNAISKHPAGFIRSRDAQPPRSVNGVTLMPRHKVRRPWLDYLVYLGVRLVVAFAQVLTIEQSYALARFMAWVVYRSTGGTAWLASRISAGVRRPIRQIRARSRRPRSLSALLPDADGDPAHSAEASSQQPGASM